MSAVRWENKHRAGAQLQAVDPAAVTIRLFFQKTVIKFCVAAARRKSRHSS